MHPFVVFLRIAFGQLWVDCGLKIDTEVVHDVLHLHRDATCCINSWIEEYIQQNIQALRVSEHGQNCRSLSIRHSRKFL